MSRYENEDLSGLNLPEDTREENSHTHGDLTCAKTIYDHSTNITSYYILCAGSKVYDPTEIDVRYKTRNNWKLRRVKKSIYDMYLNFLSNKRKALLYQIEREV